MTATRLGLGCGGGICRRRRWYEQKRANQRLALKLVWAVSRLALELAWRKRRGRGGHDIRRWGWASLEKARGRGTMLSRDSHCSSVSTSDIGHVMLLLLRAVKWPVLRGISWIWFSGILFELLDVACVMLLLTRWVTSHFPSQSGRCSGTTVEYKILVTPRLDGLCRM